MPIMTQEEFREEYKRLQTQVVGTCAYEHCNRPVMALDRYTQLGKDTYHEGCLEQKELDEFSAHIDEHPILSPGSTRTKKSQLVTLAN